MRELLKYISDPKNPEYNFSLGLWYDVQGHIASASGFYIRAAEYSSESLLSYEALLRLGNCFMRQGSHTYLTKGIFLRAISVKPERPEGYFLLSQLYETNKEWHEAYSFAVMGQNLSENQARLRTNVGYPGRYALIYEQAVTAWWIGLFDESLALFRQLDKMHCEILPVHAISIQSNLKTLEEFE